MSTVPPRKEVARLRNSRPPRMVTSATSSDSSSPREGTFLLNISVARMTSRSRITIAMRILTSSLRISTSRARPPTEVCHGGTVREGSPGEETPWCPG